MTPTPIEIAWAAGIFEGEGCYTISGTRYPHARLKLSMTDFDIVRRFHSIVQVGQTCIHHSKNPEHQDQLCWYTGAKDAVIEVIHLFWPWLGNRRRDRATELLALADPQFEGWDTPRVF